ncbi:MAG: thiamine phosphate synthase [Lachnospiraceae bacterium]|nr:thiamine phosphate synthase [Lachnospiraceae bacterium]
MSMYKTICITSRHLVTGDYNTQIKKALSRRPYALILREKDLTEKDYEYVAKDVIKLCDEAGVKCILHTFDEVALRLGVKEIHMPLNKLLTMDDVNKKKFDVIGASTHSVEDAVLAEQNGASYITAGHVFATDCKKGVPPRGLSFLEEVCHAVSIPTYAIGGIHKDNAIECIKAGAAGVCMMSEFMR